MLSFKTGLMKFSAFNLYFKLRDGIAIASLFTFPLCSIDAEMNIPTTGMDCFDAELSASFSLLPLKTTRHRKHLLFNQKHQWWRDRGGLNHQCHSGRPSHVYDYCSFLAVFSYRRLASIIKTTLINLDCCKNKVWFCWWGRRGEQQIKRVEISDSLRVLKA